MDTATATPEVKPLTLAALPALGAPFGPGLFAGLTTKPDGTHCAVVLLADKPPKLLPWKKAVAWAEELGAELPARPVAALLYANCKDQFDLDPSWHWTSEALDGSGAWYQTFGTGTQYGTHKSYEGRARAVRLIHLVA
jgi:hypothetical protein